MNMETRKLVNAFDVSLERQRLKCTDRKLAKAIEQVLHGLNNVAKAEIVSEMRDRLDT